MRILFQGDSITDANRDKRNYHELGSGYPKYAAELIESEHPDIDFEFINFGISGNRTCQLFDRLYDDGIVFAPDIISILIGINDIWHRHDFGKIETTDAQIQLNYRCILERLRRQTNSKIVMLQPFLLDSHGIDHLREDFARLLPIVDALAAEFADVYVPLNEYFSEALKTQPAPLYYSADGVHPNAEGAKFIAEHYKNAINKLL